MTQRGNNDSINGGEAYNYNNYNSRNQKLDAPLTISTYIQSANMINDYSSVDESSFIENKKDDVLVKSNCNELRPRKQIQILN